MKIYISNLGDQVTEESLTATFATYGKVSSANVATQDQRGFALVEMPDATEAAIAMSQINGSIIDGRAIIAEETIDPLLHNHPFPAEKQD
jgi:RNA recognition motif-containing protein